MKTTITFCLFIALFCGKSVAVWTRFDLVRPWLGAWDSNGQISYIKFDSKKNGLNMSSGALFGSSVANIGDINSDGVDDIAVGAPGESSFINSTGTTKNCGGIYILFLNKNASVQSFTHINSSTNGGPVLNYNDQFGYSVASAGDLDGDSVPDIIVGAPGYAISAVYILFLHKNGTVKSFQLVRGKIKGAVEGPGVIINGPPVNYGGRLGSAIANIGDLNLDGVQDFAVSALDFSSGYCAVYILFMSRNGIVKSYSTIDNFGQGGGPNLAILQDFTGFGSSIVAIGDLNHDGIADLAVGANTVYDAGSKNLNAGAVFVCFMNRNGSVQSYTRISELSGRPEYSLPLVTGDNCGQSVASIGDINLDNMKQRHPTRLHSPPKNSVPDIVMGCPESSQGSLHGRLFFVFLSPTGGIQGSTELPATSDAVVGPQLHAKDQFGWAMSGYRDVDGNGIREIFVGAPGDDESCVSCGAVYLLFPRRRRFHPIPFDAVKFGLIVGLPSLFCLILIGAGFGYFLWRYRRLPDPIEKLVCESGLKIDANRARKVYVSASSPEDKCYDYTD